jgi:hypothetical protein
MCMNEAYKQKIEAEIELAQAQLAELKAQAKSYAADARIKYTQQVEKFEQNVDATWVEMKELVEDRNDDWEQFRGGVEGAWSALLKFA